MANNRQSQSGSEKRGSAMLLLPLFGAAFSLPPIMNLFNHRALVFGMPLEFLYLFGVWTLMVVIAFFITRKQKKPILKNNEDRP